MQFGSKVKVRYRGSELSGRFINKSGKSIVLKLDNGYNITLSDEECEFLSSTYEDSEGETDIVESYGTGPLNIMMLHTGGTIASRVDYATGAVTPVQDLRFLSPGLRNLQKKVTVHSKVIDNVLSENMVPDHWQRIATEVARHMKSFDGIVVTHGTDTMTYTSSALSFMFEEQTVPVVFTGSQRSSDRPSSDAFHNIEGAVVASTQNIGEVCISSHLDTSDSTMNILRAVRSRKMHSSKRNAISSVGSGLIGEVQAGEFRKVDIRKPRSDRNVIKSKLEKDVLLYYFSPMSRPEDFLTIAQGNKVSVIIGTGLGHIGDRFLEPIKELTEQGSEVIITSQTLFGEINLNVYSTGIKLQEAGAFSVGRILPEVAAIKAMWVLANFKSEDFRNIMQSDIRGENPSRETLDRT